MYYRYLSEESITNIVVMDGVSSFDTADDD